MTSLLTAQLALAATARRRARFQLGGATIEAAVSKLGMKYVRIRPDGSRRTTPLQPVAGTAEAWRARPGSQHRTVSRLSGFGAVLVLVAALSSSCLSS